MAKINWGIIGLGDVASQFSQNFPQLENCNIIAISSRNIEKLNLFKKIFRIEEKFCFLEYEDLINCDEIDVIYIALPNSFHYEWIVKCISKKKHVLVEKPITQNYLELEKINVELLRNKSKVIEGFMYKFYPQTKKILNLITNNEIGRIHSIESSFGSNLLTKKKFFFFKKKKNIDGSKRLFNKDLGGGCILDLGCYPVSLTTLILNEIGYKKLEFSVKNKIIEMGNTGVEIDAHINLEFKDNIIADLRCSFKENIGSKTIIRGSEGEIEFEDTWIGPKKITVSKKEKKYEIKYDKMENIYYDEIRLISESLIKNKEIWGINMVNSLENMKILDNWKK